jgi:uncharacterized protein YdhG (YjbR/CyaY superfamily)
MPKKTAQMDTNIDNTSDHPADRLARLRKLRHEVEAKERELRERVLAGETEGKLYTAQINVHVTLKPKPTHK